MKASVDELRRVAADLLRQGGDEEGARVVERTSSILDSADAITKLTDRTEATLGGVPMESLAEAVQRVVLERNNLRGQLAAERSERMVRIVTSNSTTL